MSLITTNPASDHMADLQATAAPFRRSSPAPAFRPEIGRSLRMHPRAALLVGLTVLAAALFVGLGLKPAYMAESRIYIEPAVSSPLSDPNAGGLFDSVRYDSYLQQQMQTATRVDILKTAIESLPPGTWTLPGETTDAAAHRLGAALKVGRITTSYQMSIALTGGDPKKTAAVVNAVTTAYLDAGRRDELSHSTSRAQILTEERDRITRELADARAEQASLGAALGVASPGTAGVNSYDEQLTALRGELIAARQAHDAAAAQLTSVAGKNPSAAPGLNALATEMSTGDAGLASLKASVNQRRATLVEQMATMTPSNPAYKLDQDELAELDKVVSGMETQLRDQAANRLEGKLRVELERTGDMESRLNGEIARGTAQATGAAPKLERSQELTGNIARLTARFATIDDALRTLELETHSMPMAHLSLAAAVPTQPEPSRRKLVLLAALPLALLLACLAASLLHRRDRHIYIAQDMEDLLGFTPIAVLPSRADVSAAVLEEYVLRLAGGIENAYRTRGARTFVLTPVSVATPLSFLMEQLAAKLTALGLVVATVHVAELLDNPAALTALTTSGTHESRMASALEQLKTSFDLIFIAAPALLTSAEAEYVARSANATILVAECGVTLKEELTAAAVLLERLQVTGVGTVLDEVTRRYADRAFRTALASVEARLTKVEAPRRAAATESLSRPETLPAAMPAEPVHIEPAAPDQQASEGMSSGENMRHEDAAVPAADVIPEPIAESNPQDHPEPMLKENEAAVTHAAFEHLAAAAEPLAESTAPSIALPEPYAAEIVAQHQVQTQADPQSTGPVWPAATSRMEPSTTVRAFEQELLSAKGTSVFLRPRAATERRIDRIERLEPLGTPDSLAPAAEMLAASFGTLPMEIEPTPADVLYPKGTTLAEAEALRIARAKREALASGKAIGPTQEPLQMDEIRRLLNPVKAETTIETRNGKDMIGARAVSEAARQTQLQGWTPDGEPGMTAKKNWFQKLFQRDAEPGFSLARNEEETDSAVDEESNGSSRSNSLYDLPMGRTSYSGERAVAVAEAPVQAAVAQVEDAAGTEKYEDHLALAENASGYRPVARVVSLLTPVDDPSAPTAPIVVAEVTPQPERVVAPVAKPVAPPAAPPKSSTPQMPVTRRPKSFFELTQARRRPALADLVAERAIAVAATPSMLQETEPIAMQADVDEPAAPAESVGAISASDGEQVQQTFESATDELSPETQAIEAAPEQTAHVAGSAPEPVEPQAEAIPAASEAVEPAFLHTPEPVHDEEPAQSQSVAAEHRNVWGASLATYCSPEFAPEREPATEPVPVPVRRGPAYWPSANREREYPVRARLVEDRHEDEPRLQTRSENRTAPHEPGLSRRWGLLSRYQQAEQPAERGADEYRNGRE